MSLPPGEIGFVDNQVPALLANDYAVALAQTVTGDGVAGTYAYDQTMQVIGPHFGLDGVSVHAMYPPAGSTADYTEAVPSIVLNRPALPWMIAPTPAQNESGPLVTPWLMLLLLTPEEIITPAGVTTSPSGAHSVPLADYLSPRTDIVGPDFTKQQIAEFEADYPANYETLVVDVAAEAFTATAPTVDELTYLAHARDVDADDGELGPDTDDGLYSVVIGNRLARGSATGIYLAHLVSAEGFTTLLPPADLPAGTTAVRLVSLASWTFTGTPGTGNFAGQMANLGVGLPILPTSQPAHPSPAQQVIAGAVTNGYVGLAYQTRFGEQTICWYRGPGLPLLMQANPQPAYTGSSQALIYDTATGMFDVSYAVAWETGRMLLLANRAITVSLLAWLRRQQKTSHLLLDRLRRMSIRTDPSLSSPNELTAPRLVSHHARSLLADRMSRGLTAPNGAGLFGPIVDATGLRHVARRLPGLHPPPDSAGLPAAPDRRSSATDQTTVAEPDRERSTYPRLPRAQAIRRLFASPTARSLLADMLEPLPDDVIQWLAQLTLMSGLPFTTIVPDTRMLPPETIRFFHLDQNWVRALLDGALSVIDLCEPDTAVLDLCRTTIQTQATEAAGMLRTQRIKETRTARNARRALSGRPAATIVDHATNDPPPPMPWSGFVLRSAAVADWPGLTVTAFADSAGNQPVKILRLDRVAPTVLFGIAGGILQRIRIAKPATVLHFGVVHQDADHSATGAARDLVYIRGLGGRFPAGVQLPNDPFVTAEVRPDSHGRAVLQIATLHTDLTAALVAAYGSSPTPQTPPVPSAAFGMQMVAGAEAELFISGVHTLPPQNRPPGSEPDGRP
jgi:hypothetical protein